MRLVGVKPMKQINVQLSEKTLIRVKEIAGKEELAYTSLIRNWIVQKTREYAPVQPSTAQTGAANTAKEVSA